MCFFLQKLFELIFMETHFNGCDYFKICDLDAESQLKRVVFFWCINIFWVRWLVLKSTAELLIYIYTCFV